MTPEEVLAFAEKHGAKFVDFKFVDLPGTWQHFSVPLHQIGVETFVEGKAFDGSSLRGFQSIDNSDMMIIPDANTAILDPFTALPTLSLICDVAFPGPTGPKTSYSRDPRYIARKAETYLKSSGVADICYFGPEAEFFIFDNVRYKSSDNIQYAEVDSEEAHWNGDRGGAPNLGHHIRVKEGYFPVAPNDTQQDIRTEMVAVLESLGITIEAYHHEVGGPGQGEIDIRFDTLLKTADNLLTYKYVVKNVAKKYGKSVTFMPKPVFGDNGTGMHTHQSLWKDEKPLFYDENAAYAGLSQLGRYYVGGILTHARSLLAIGASTTNSYKRLVPGFEAPVNLVFSQGNRSAAVRIPLTFSGAAKRIEFRSTDAASNPYLLFSALLMAGLDGIRKEIDPSDHGFGPVDKNLFDMSAEELREIKSVPGSLHEALNALEDDHEYLLEGGVFTTDVLEHYVEFKRGQANESGLRPTPYEFALYYDV